MDTERSCDTVDVGWLIERGLKLKFSPAVMAPEAMTTGMAALGGARHAGQACEASARRTPSTWLPTTLLDPSVSIALVMRMNKAVLA